MSARNRTREVSAAKAEALVKTDALRARRRRITQTVVPGDHIERASGRDHRVLFVVSEMADYIKAGGLGDVAASPPRCRVRCATARTCVY